MFRFGILTAVFAALLSIAVAQANPPSGHRSALLIGNSEYGDFKLPGIKPSLDEAEKALRSHGFEVTRHENLKEDDLKKSVEAFSASVPTGGVTVVYYTGLAAHIERQGKWYNLLRPVGEKVESDNDYRSVGLNVGEDLLEPLTELSGANFNLVFLDACWDSPIRPENGNVHGGLREMETSTGTLVMFAAGSEKSLPVPDSNNVSPLAKALSIHLATFDTSISEAATSIAKDNDNAWFGGAVERGIGVPLSQGYALKLQEGKQPGAGYFNSIGMTFRWCPPGSFTMGSEQTDGPATRDRTPVDVKLTRGFWMGEHEVTQREYYAVMRKTVGREFTTAKNAPFWGVSESKQINDFCKKLSDIERKAGRLPSGWEYICPSEAQWEYAARAGSKSRYCFGDSISELGKYGNVADAALHDENPNYYYAARETNDGYGETLAPVGSFMPNAWGLRDMHGNVAEIVADHLVADRPGGADPLVRVEKEGVSQIRGGAWCSIPLYCESSFRNALSPGQKHPFVGFRVALIKK